MADWQIVGLMTLSGVLGGVAGEILTDTTEAGYKRWAKGALLGVVAALVVPLFLTSVSSELLAHAFDSSTTPKLLVLCAYCLLAATGARRFITALSDNLLRKQLDEAVARNHELEHQTESLRTEAEETLKDVTSGLTVVATPTAPNNLDDDVGTVVDVQPGPDADDPWKDQFGGKSRDRGRKLTARIRRVPQDDKLRLVTIVVSTDGSAPLDGNVVFYLHPTFDPHIRTVHVSNGEARLNLVCWGAFTLGALADQGKTKLELDLQEHPEADEPWKSR
jgi:hypothetical protein